MERILTVGLVGLVLGGCSLYDDPYVKEESTTGVSGLNTPEEILARPEIKSAINLLQIQGYDCNPSFSNAPQSIEGFFEPQRKASFQIAPNPNAGGILPFLALRVENQTSDNYVEVSRLQKDLTDNADEQTIGRAIIRGSDSHFTVYSVQEIHVGDFCRAQRVWVIDGTKNDDGTFTTMDLRIPTEVYTPECVFPDFAESISYSSFGE
jgi:hypothetical protein